MDTLKIKWSEEEKQLFHIGTHSSISTPKQNKILENIFEIRRKIVLILKEKIDRYYKSWTPSVYKRTNSFDKLSQSIKDENKVKIIDGGYMAVIDIPTELTKHSSIFNKAVTVDTFMLLENGYKVEKDVFLKDIPNLGYRNGLNGSQPPHHIIRDTLKEIRAMYPDAIITFEE